MEQNNSDFGLSLQKHICVTYEIKKIPGYAIKEFNANYNNSYESELEMIRKKIFDTLRVKPVECLTYKKEIINDKKMRISLVDFFYVVQNNFGSSDLLY